MSRRQHGVITAAQLHGAGLSKGGITHRRSVGRLHSIHRGVYAIGDGSVTFEALLHAAVLAIGGDAVLSHVSAAALWRLLRAERLDPRRPPDVSTTRSLKQRRGIRIHLPRSLPRSDTTRLKGIPVTTPARTLIDIATAVPDNWLRRALREAEVQRLVDPAQLARQLEHRRGAYRLRELLGAGPAPTRSELEDRVLELVGRNGLPRPQINTMVRAGGRTYEVDFLFAGRRLIVEADGRRYHDTPSARRADAARDAALTAAGYRILRLTWEEVTGAAQRETVDRLRIALAAAPA